jgi:hypothetical protein
MVKINVRKRNDYEKLRLTLTVRPLLRLRLLVARPLEVR